jgi:hypothetical protein
MTTLVLYIEVSHGTRKRGIVSDRRITFIPILVKFRPGDVVSPLKTENRVMVRALLARGKVAWLLAAGVVYEVHL